MVIWLYFMSWCHPLLSSPLYNSNLSLHCFFTSPFRLTQAQPTRQKVLIIYMRKVPRHVYPMIERSKSLPLYFKVVYHNCLGDTFLIVMDILKFIVGQWRKKYQTSFGVKWMKKEAARAASDKHNCYRPTTMMYYLKRAISIHHWNCPVKWHFYISIASRSRNDNTLDKI